jgi:hypothetical protein
MPDGLILLAEIGAVLLVVAARLYWVRRRKRRWQARRTRTKGHQAAWGWVMGRRRHRQITYVPRDRDPTLDA